MGSVNKASEVYVKTNKYNRMYVKGVSIFASIDGAYQLFLPILQGRSPESEINSAVF
jgi:hypothetical protein